MITALLHKKSLPLTLTLLLCLTLGTYAQDSPAKDVHDIGHFSRINNDIRFYFDTSGTLPLEKVMQADFHLGKARELAALNRLKGAYYARFTLTNSGNQPARQLLYLGKAMNNDIYQLDPETSALSRLPEPVPFESTVFFNEIPYSDLTIPAHARVDYLIRVDLHFYNKTFFDPVLVDPNQRVTFEFSHLMVPVRPYIFLTILQLGILLAMGLFGLFRYLGSGRAEYLYYSIATLLLVISFGLQALSHFTFEKWFFYTETFRTHILEFGGFCFLLLYVTRLMDLRQQQPDLNRMFKVIMGAMGLFIIIDLFLAFSDLRQYLSMDTYYGMEIFLLCSSTYAVLSSFKPSSRISWFLMAGTVAFFIPSAIALYLSRASGPWGADGLITGAPSAIFMTGTLFLLFNLLLGSGYKSKYIEIGRMKAIEALRLENEKNELEQYRAVMEAKDKERNRIAQQIHDEIGTGLTSIRLHSEIAERREGREWKPDFTLISTTTNRLLDKMNEILWTMNSHNDSLANLVAYLRHQIVEYFEPHHIDLRLIIPDNLPDMEISSTIRRNILVSVKEALHNIVSITHGNRVEIEFIADQQFTIIIRDNGLALPSPEDRSAGNGIRNLDERLRAVGGAYSVTEGKNSTQQLQVPIR
jgi:signal transduction histidine kinase